MRSRDFCFWLQGWLEICGAASDPDMPGAAEVRISQSQLDCIRRHLALVFRHEIDPSMGDQATQQALNEIHHPKPQPWQQPQEPGGLLIRC